MLDSYVRVMPLVDIVVRVVRWLLQESWGHLYLVLSQWPFLARHIMCALSWKMMLLQAVQP